MYNYKKNKLEQLKGFCAVVECGSITQAAKKLNISESSISLQITSLEKDLGLQLFQKTGRSLKLNKNGEIYYDKAKDILEKVNDIYNQKLDLKVDKFEILKLKIINQIAYSHKIIRKNIKKFVTKIKIMHFIILTIFLTTLLYYIYNKIVIEKNIQIVKSITKNINDADKSLENIITNDVIFIKEYFSSHPNMNRDELLKIKEQINNPTISIYDQNGYFYLTTSRTMDPTYEHYHHYKNLSVLKGKSSSKVLSTMATCVKAYNTPNKIFVLPIYGRRLPYKNITKNAILYDNKLRKIFDVSYSGQNIQKIIDQNFDIYKDIVYIGLSDKNGNIILQKGDYVFDKKMIKKFNKYSEEILITKDKKFTIFQTPFGGEKDVVDMTTNGDKTYFYVLNIVFRKVD
jgi:molybdenum-dependent DNA-binding transcriptional regulator ModE